MKIDRMDHIVLTVRDVAATVAFYTRVLGMEERRYGEGRIALCFGRNKINLHPNPSPIEPRAAAAMPGSADICLVTEAGMEAVTAHLAACDVAIEVGPRNTVGALGTMTSVYFRDPDNNLVEVASY